MNLSVFAAAAQAAAVLSPMLLAAAVVAAIGPAADWRCARRKRRQSRHARPVTTEHAAWEYCVARAIARGVRLEVTS